MVSSLWEAGAQRGHNVKSLTPRDLVVELLTTLHEAEVGFNPGNGDDGVKLMPTLYKEGSYAELERCLDLMRDTVQWHQSWWHVTQRYLAGQLCTLDVTYRRTVKGPYPQLPGRSELQFVEAVLDNRQMRIRIYRWDSRVADSLVDTGLTQLLSLMYGGDTQRIQLPLEFLYRALGKELPDAKANRSSSSFVPTEALAVA